MGNDNRIKVERLDSKLFLSFENMEKKLSIAIVFLLAEVLNIKFKEN
ncbi:hypothetical protein OHV48_15555 [Acinetobacter baumannii]|nr:hypothetical protein [Acinetobacter baumannii]